MVAAVCDGIITIYTQDQYFLKIEVELIYDVVLISSVGLHIYIYSF